jgi:hypothetical protein
MTQQFQQDTHALGYVELVFDDQNARGHGKSSASWTEAITRTGVGSRMMEKSSMRQGDDQMKSRAGAMRRRSRWIRCRTAEELFSFDVRRR